MKKRQVRTNHGGMSMDKERYVIRAAERTLQILNCFQGESEELSISDIAGLVGLPKSSVHRFLVTMELNGFIEVNPLSHNYCLGSKIISLGSLAISRVKLAEKGQPYLLQLSKSVQATVHIVVMNQGEGIYIGKVEERHSIISSYVGKRVPLHCTAVGKVLLGSLSSEEIDDLYQDPKKLKCYTQNTITDLKLLKEHVQEVCKNGYALDNEEIEEGLRCVAAPVKNHEGRTIAAISVSSFTQKFSTDRLPEIIDQVQTTATKISKAVGYNGGGNDK
ncbi:MAG: IclR family transcriptional regulator [Desulfitobacteriaceae bacterium]